VSDLAQPEDPPPAPPAEAGPRPGVSPRSRSICLVAILVFLVAVALWRFGPWGGVAPGIEVLTEQAWVAWEQGDRAAVDAVWEQVEARAPDSTQAQLLRGMALLGAGKSAQALEPLREAARAPSTRAKALVLAARAYLETGSLGGAEEVLRTAIDESPDDIAARRLAGAVYYDLGVNSQAIVHLEAVGRLDPTDARPFRLIGLMRKDFQDYPAAIAAYEETLRRARPDSPLLTETRLELAQCLKESRRYEEAISALSPQDQSSEAQAVRLAAHTSLGQLDAARKIVAGIPADGMVSASLCMEAASFDAVQGRTDDEVRWLERAIEADPVDFVPRYRLASALARAGKTAAADEQRAKSDEQRAKHERLHALQMEAMKDPRNAKLRCDLGHAALALERKELARVWFQAALGLDPTNTEAQRELGKLSGR
jgi:cellulose synthase operon protein C